MIKRFRIDGSDLLAPGKQARRKVANRLTDKPPRLEIKINEWPWRKVGSKAAVMDRYDEWVRKGGGAFRVALPGVDGRRVLIVVDMEEVRKLGVANCSPGTELAWSLIKHAFPAVAFGGGYVWKETSPGIWSDHAWGTAVDPSFYAANDKGTDWVARMARAGYLDFDYALGSRDGRVVIIDGDGDVAPSGASSSHLWHVHVSVVDHDGRKPPRMGGVW